MNRSVNLLDIMKKLQNHQFRMSTNYIKVWTLILVTLGAISCNEFTINCFKTLTDQISEISEQNMQLRCPSKPDNNSFCFPNNVDGRHSVVYIQKATDRKYRFVLISSTQHGDADTDMDDDHHWVGVAISKNGQGQSPTVYCVKNDAVHSATRSSSHETDLPIKNTWTVGAPSPYKMKEQDGHEFTCSFTTPAKIAIEVNGTNYATDLDVDKVKIILLWGTSEKLATLTPGIDSTTSNETLLSTYKEMEIEDHTAILDLGVQPVGSEARSKDDPNAAIRPFQMGNYIILYSGVISSIIYYHL